MQNEYKDEEIKFYRSIMDVLVGKYQKNIDMHLEIEKIDLTEIGYAYIFTDKFFLEEEVVPNQMLTIPLTGMEVIDFEALQEAAIKVHEGDCVPIMAVTVIPTKYIVVKNTPENLNKLKKATQDRSSYEFSQVEKEAKNGMAFAGVSPDRYLFLDMVPLEGTNLQYQSENRVKKEVPNAVSIPKELLKFYSSYAELIRDTSVTPTNRSVKEMMDGLQNHTLNLNDLT